MSDLFGENQKANEKLLLTTQPPLERKNQMNEQVRHLISDQFCHYTEINKFKT